MTIKVTKDVVFVRFLRLYCTGCDEHIGSTSAEKHIMTEHSVLQILLCEMCQEFYGDAIFIHSLVTAKFNLSNFGTM
ncbi:hypothetical protein TSAR_014365 [Trichomalopsis sarcophagae]|uniref:Uncharacterized protein n=1 Tax=Trichomalopsis sarcophagae TaxID=543379 RepID=A0A232EMC2_9HYME|nr:hypothetical protein TSAR_014365 [Trichomalopsis sarcophagae]